MRLSHSEFADDRQPRRDRRDVFRLCRCSIILAIWLLTLASNAQGQTIFSHRKPIPRDQATSEKARTTSNVSKQVDDPANAELPLPLKGDQLLELLRFQDVAPLLPRQQLTPFDSDISLPNPIIPPSEHLLSSRLNRQNRRRMLANVPNMIGDTNDGGCGTVEFLPSLSGTVEHPTFNCVRLNVAEANSPIPRDRIYLRYNHFHNITTVSVFPGSFAKGTSELHVDRITLGGEKTFLDGAGSLEVRIPFSRELTSDVILENIKEETNFPIDDYAAEFGNVSFLAKFLLLETERSIVSWGLALNTPTADDGNVRMRVDDDEFPVTFPNQPTLFFIDVDADATVSVDNEVFNLSPFAGFVLAPSREAFLHGFVQLDFPLNDANISYGGRLNINGREETFRDSGKYTQQNLLRINLGAGHWLYDDPDARHLTGVAATLELHLTSTLEDAELYRQKFPIPLLPVGPPLSGELTVGNLANRVDILNLTLGGVFEFWDQTTLAHGFVLPLRNTGANHPFDFEYSLQLNHSF